METINLYNVLVPNKHKVFFDKHGLSITEANHKANLLSELATAIEAEFKSTGAYKEELIFDGGDIIQLNTFKKIELENQATKEGDLYALSAWLREAVKAKTQILDDIKSMSYISFLEDNEEYPDFKELKPVQKRVELPIYITEDDVIGKFTIAERAKYLALN